MATGDLYTRLLLHMDGEENGTNFTDMVGNTIITTGNVCTKTAIKKFGVTSGYFDGSGDYIRTTAVTFGAIDFTMECWIYMLAMPTSDSWPGSWSSHMSICGVGTAGAGNGCNLVLGQTKLILQSNDGQIISGLHGITIGSWHHVAVTRSGTTFRLFVDGIIIATATSSATMGTGAYTYIGCETGEGAWFNGYIDELRISLSIARWTSNFTPETVPYVYVPPVYQVDDEYTKLLFHMNGEDNGTLFPDEGGHTISVVGNTCTKTTQVKFGSTSGYFDGTTDRLEVANSDDFNFGSGDFTVEGWFYFLTNTKGYQFLIDRRGGGDGTGWALYVEGNNTLSFLSSSSSGWDNQVIYGISQPPINEWLHIAVVRYGNIWTFYKNGISIKTGTYTGAIGAQTAPLVLGRSRIQDGWEFQGYMDEVRISKGIARWTANFTPPTTPYAANFKLSGNAVFGPYILPEMLVAPASSTIAWSEDIPAGTSLTLKAAIVSTTPIESDYLDILNGGVIPGLSLDSSGKNLYIKAYLATTDVTKTPKLLTSPQYVITEAPDLKAVQLDLSELGRIKAPIGNIVDVGFTGLLSGLGGSNVDPFSLSFSPTEIVPYFNPNDAEHLSVAVAPTIAVTEVTYLYAQEGAEYLTAQVAGISIVATLIGSIPL